MSTKTPREKLRVRIDAAIVDLGAYLDKVLGELQGSYDRELDEIENRTDSWDPDDFAGQIEVLYSQHKEVFLPTFSYSFIVVAHSQLDYYVRATARILKEEKGHPLALSDLRGDLLKRVDLFLASLSLRPVASTFSEPIGRLVLLRNCIVHNAALVLDFEKEKALRAAIKAEPEIEINEDGRIQVTHRFCRELVPKIDEYLSELLQV